MNAIDPEAVRIRLEHRRREILEASRRAVSAIDQLRLAERDPEPTEASQSEQLQYDLSRLGEAEQRELVQIDAAIARLEAGEYGICRDCGDPIDPGRLVALPFGLDCAECAREREEAEAVEREKRKPLRPMTPG